MTDAQRTKIVLMLLLSFFVIGCISIQAEESPKPWDNGRLVVSKNHRFIQHENGEPFFWLGDTAWLMFAHLDREEIVTYLENRRQKGFNVIQVSVIHRMPQFNCYQDTALTDKDPNKPLITPGHDPSDDLQYDYWDHLDYCLDVAAQKGIYLALIPCWGSIVNSKRVFTEESAENYAKYLAHRYRDKPNVIWLNGGDTRGNRTVEIWQTFGRVLHQEDKNHLMTFHPVGRTQSSTWFHNEDWLDFNMFQSGHRRYDQRRETDDIVTWKGEDNWKYVFEDYAKTPPKPTIDGEPSYENISQGLRPGEPRWQAKDVRRYAYWSVFAGSFGHTYGNGFIMGMTNTINPDSPYGTPKLWSEAIDDPGAGQMQYLKHLILARPFFERVSDQSIVIANGERYDYIAATRGESYALFYTYTGREFEVALGKITGDKVKATWYSPRDGQSQFLGIIDNQGSKAFDPPGDQEDGNDWVLILDDAAKPFPLPNIN